MKRLADEPELIAESQNKSNNMLQFVIIARDGIDADATGRRLAVRSTHLDGARKLKANNNFLVGGATLNEDGQMNGSVMLVQFPTEEEMKQWLENEPYVTGNVWETIEIRRFKVTEI